MKMKLPQRKHPARQPIYDSGNRANIIFLTVCTHQRKRILTNETVHRVLRDAWIAADHWIVLIKTNDIDSLIQCVSDRLFPQAQSTSRTSHEWSE